MTTIHVPRDLAEHHGRARQGAHVHNTTERFFKDETQENRVGVTVELAFSQLTGLSPNLETLPHGDGNIDFAFQVRGRTLTVDVKGAANPKYLFLKAACARQAADILVLAHVDGQDVTFIGWEHKSLMLLMPRRDFGYGIVNFYRPRKQLRPVYQLTELIQLGSGN